MNNYHPKKSHKNRNYHPDSWSEQARFLANRIYAQCGTVDWGYNNLDEVMHFFSSSYRCERIVNRACKRFHRLYNARNPWQI